ncbi:hypothetical protein ACJ41P_26520 [Azospirillum argentinense]|uniref:Transcriptional regulator n=1 Tax=Azospirillum argentinense TaxID=2970906 RepID=A0ABW8VE28_9PROT
MKTISDFHRGILVRFLAKFAEAELSGRVLSARDVAVAIGLSENTGPGLRRELVELEWLRVVRQGYVRHPTVVAVTDAGWEVLGGRPAVSPKAKTRACLCCGRTFASDGPHHRICDGCRKTDAYQSGGLDTAYQVPL